MRWCRRGHAVASVGSGAASLLSERRYATTLLKFRRLLEESQLTRRVFEEIKAHLARKGLTMREGTIVDATLIAAPPSTKNRDGERDPEMHQS